MPLNRTAAYEQLIKFFLNQHGFKQRRSTTSLSLTIQTLIAQALEEDCHVLMASIDLTAAFDMVNIDLLLKRMKIIDLPPDLSLNEAQVTMLL